VNSEAILETPSPHVGSGFLWDDAQWVNSRFILALVVLRIVPLAGLVFGNFRLFTNPMLQAESWF
jgi:hypothetical protein